jgi:hypothetical protein
MRRRVLLAAIAVALAIAFGCWLARDPDLAPPHREQRAEPTHTEPAASNVVERSSTGTASTDPRAEPPSPTPTTSEPHTLGLVLRVRLRGLHPDAPWTAKLQLDVDGRDDGRDQWLDFDASAVIDGAGTATIALPDWYATATQQKGRLEATDANYQDLEHRWNGKLDLAQELVVDVQAVAVLTGRVVDAAGQPVPAARVVAFALRAGQPVDGQLGTTNCRADGTWRLAAPSGVPLWLLAVPMRAAGGSRRVVGLDGAIPDHGEMRDDLLPASAIATGHLGAPSAVPDLVLVAAAAVTGRVRWLDGEGLPDVRVHALPRGGSTFALANSTFVQRDLDGRLSPGAVATTVDGGEFVLPAVPGASLDVQVRSLGGGEEHGALIGPPLQQSAVAPQRLEFALPRPVLVVVRNGDATVAGAIVEVDGGPKLRTDRRGELRVVPTGTVRLRASHERLRSAWHEVGPGDARATIELTLAADLVEVAIEFDGDFRVRNTIVQWRRDDGVEGREHLLRDDRPGAFRVFLEPGRYRVTAGPGGGERNGVFLLPVERDIEVGAERVELRLPAVFGGTFTVMATNRAGAWVGGRCVLIATSGEEVPVRFRRNGREGTDGELLADGTNACTRVLAPGEYELQCDFGEHGAVRERFRVTPREVTEVRVRLP